jgi:HEAT repeat protein
VWDARTGEPLTRALALGDYSPFDRGGIGAMLAGDVLLVRRSFKTSQFDRWSLVANRHSAADLRDLAEALAGRRLDAAGNVQPIPAGELFALRKRSASKFPDRFGQPVSAAEEVLMRRPDPRVKELAERLTNVKLSKDVRSRMGHALGELRDPTAAASLLVALRDREAEVRRAAANALGRLDPQTTPIVRGLVSALKEDTDALTRSSAARALRGSSAKVAAAELLRALKNDRDTRVRASAAFALRRAPADPALLAVLRDACKEGMAWNLRIEAAMTVAVLVPKDTAGVGVLIAALEQKDQWAEGLALEYLYELGPRAAPAAAALTRLVEKGNFSPDNMNRAWYAMHALARIGPAAKPAAPTLLAQLDRDQANPHWHNHATNYVPARNNMMAYTLARIGPDMVQDLLKVVKDDKNQHRRRAAVFALGFLGPKANSAIPALEAEAKKLADKEDKNRDEQWLEKAIDKALGRMRDPKAMPVEKME